MRIGIIGAGQLGQMLGFAARGLGDTCRFLDPSPAPPAAVAGPVIDSAFDDAAGLAELAADADVVTYEFENVGVDALRHLGGRVPVYPPIDALRQAQDRLAEKRLFERLGIPLAGYRRVDSRADLEDAVISIGLPLVLKTRRMGYDGKGQFLLQTADQLDTALGELGEQNLVAEQRVGFDYEVSAIAARSIRGDLAFYPLTRNEHAGGILRTSRAPVENPGLAGRANRYVERLLGELDYVGVIALELFVVGDRLLANEFAPRVHNSGHWTIEGAETSQFANHVRAITDRALGATTCRGHCGMVNLIGDIPAAARQLGEERGFLHDYGKAPRPGRKLGHISVVAKSAAERDRQIAEILQTVTQVTRCDGPTAWQEPGKTS